jgi:hypothetical protein
VPGAAFGPPHFQLETRLDSNARQLPADWLKNIYFSETGHIDRAGLSWRAAGLFSGEN